MLNIGSSLPVTPVPRKQAYARKSRSEYVAFPEPPPNAAPAIAAPAIAAPAAPLPKESKPKTYKTNDGGEVDASRRYLGGVTQFFYQKGFGFIKPDIKDERIFVHWSNIKSSDDWPALKEGMKVAFYIGKSKDGRHFAAEVTDYKGRPISLDTEEVQVYDHRSWFGKVRYFDANKGFGFLEVLEDIRFRNEPSARLGMGGDLYVDKSDIVSDDPNPILLIGTEVEFNIRENTKGLTAINVRIRGGYKVMVSEEERQQALREELAQQYYQDDGMQVPGMSKKRNEKRTHEKAFGFKSMPGFEKPKMQVLEREAQVGEVDFWNDKKGYGWINPFKDLSGYDGSNRVYFKTTHVSDPDLVIQSGLIVQFTLYCDAKGLGAMNVRMASEIQQAKVLAHPSKRRKTEETLVHPELTKAENFEQQGVKMQVLQSHIGVVLNNKNGLQQASGCQIDVLPIKETQPSSKTPRVISFQGRREGMKTACRLVVQRIAEIEQSFDSTVIFLISDTHAGRFIGKKGCNISKLREKTNVKVNVAHIPVLVGGKPMKTCTLEGTLQNVFSAIEETVDLIRELTVKESFSYEPPPFLFDQKGFAPAPHENPFMGGAHQQNGPMVGVEEYVEDVPAVPLPSITSYY